MAWHDCGRAILLLVATAVMASTGLSVGVSGAAERVVAVNENQNGSTIEITRAQKLEIRLPVQGGTGFSWDLTRAPSASIRLASSKILPGTAGARPGGAQTQLLVFAPTAAGSDDIELGYRRPWEKASAPARSFVLHVVVRDAGR
jgi:predicted secreted protein